MGFVLGMLLLFSQAGTLEIAGIVGRAGALGAGVCTAAGLLLFLGACGKSAQIPLYVWLPDAMAGPTPVSALIHAATMVTAGVYVVCRMAPVYLVSPIALGTVAVVGGLTAVFAATIGLCQTDIKKVLAYSTVSQLGYMMLAAGVGAFGAGIFHLMTHAFFKALLFLGAGSVIHALSGEQDIRKMGGLGRHIPWTHGTFLVAVLAIAGIPPLSGFFSKDEILLSAWSSHVPGHGWLYGIGLATAALTSFYMFRLLFRTFHGPTRMTSEDHAHVHEPATTVLAPLYVLAVLSAVAGFAGLPQVYGDWLGVSDSNSLANFLAPVVGHAEHAVEHMTELALALFAVAAALLGLALAFVLYLQRPDLPGRLAQALAAPYRLIRGKYYVDELYDAALVRPLVRLSDAVLFRAVDAGAIDNYAVNGAARAVRAAAADSLKYLQSGLAQGYLIVMMLGTAAILGWLVLS
jgi:NADH-quinone oxidoreductase subunit L